jgi:thiamine kinase
VQLIPLDNAFTADDSLRKLNQQLTIESVEALTGGLTNRCWKVVIDGCPYVWRPISYTSDSFGIDRNHEYQLLYLLNRSNLSPNAIAQFPFGILVEWIEGQVIPDDYDRKKLTPILTTLLAKLHQLPVTAKQHFSFKQRLSYYWEQLESSQRSLTSQILYQHYLQLDESQHFNATLCHFDLGGYNVIKSADGYKVIDWEYAAYSDPSQDLTMSILANDLELESAVRGYCQCREIKDVQPWIDAVHYWTPWCQFLSSLWFRLGYQLNQDYLYLVQSVAHEESVLNAINEKERL